MARNTISLLSVFLFTLNFSLNSVRAQNAANEKILFNARDLIFRQMPDSCYNDDLSYCFDKGDAYPQEKVDELVKDMSKLKIDDRERPPSYVGPRIGGDSSSEPDCPSNSTNKPIYYIVDENENVRVVVQSPEKFQQIYTVQWCQDEGRITKDTRHLLKSTLEHFNIECISARMNFDFFVLSEDETEMQIVKAKGGIPVCCKCRYNANNDDVSNPTQHPRALAD